VSKRNWSAKVTITVHDALNAPCLARPSAGPEHRGGGVLHDRDHRRVHVQRVEDPDKCASVTFTVGNVTKAGAAYHPPANHGPRR